MTAPNSTTPMTTSEAGLEPPRVRAGLDTIRAYSADRTPATIDLSDNTNLWGLPPAAARAIAAVDHDSITRYPPLYTAELKQAIASYVGHGVTPDMVVTGCGSDDVLDSAIRAFGEPGSRLAHPEPSFAMIPIFARLNSLEPIPIPLTPEFDADARAFVECSARITYLCSPNNPTGTAFSRTAIEAVVAGTPGLVIADEAYAEFAGTTVLDLLPSSPRLLVTRTLSKAFGLAGLRIGYAIGHPDVVAAVEKSRGPYKVSAVAERAAVAALTDGVEWMRQHAAAAVDARERLATALRTIGVDPLPSAANFVMAPVADSCAVHTALRARGIAIRPFTALQGIGDALRISVGPWHLLEETVAALAEAPGL